MVTPTESPDAAASLRRRRPRLRVFIARSLFAGGAAVAIAGTLFVASALRANDAPAKSTADPALLAPGEGAPRAFLYFDQQAVDDARSQIIVPSGAPTPPDPVGAATRVRRFMDLAQALKERNQLISFSAASRLRSVRAGAFVVFRTKLPRARRSKAITLSIADAASVALDMRLTVRDLAWQPSAGIVVTAIGQVVGRRRTALGRPCLIVRALAVYVSP
jgi:hypothetical protein